MIIEKDRVAAFDYTVKDEDGKVVDTSAGKTPLYYLHGHSNIVVGLEEALEGKAAGDEFTVEIPPEKGYGEYDEQRMLEVPKADLPQDVTPQKGMHLFMNAAQGGRLSVTVTKVKLKTVVMDANPPLAGKTLHFSVSVKEVRKAKKSELEHKHAHAPGQK